MSPTVWTKKDLLNLLSGDVGREEIEQLNQRIATLEAGLQREQERAAALERQFAEAQAGEQVRRLETALRHVEWAGEYQSCVLCDRFQEAGHSPDRPLAFLAQTEEETAP